MDVAARLAELAGRRLSAAVRAGQLEFDRLEWLGDSVLDVLVSRHLCLHDPSRSSIEELAHRRTELVSDRALRRTAARHALPAVPLSNRTRRHAKADIAGRLGDSVEAWVGAAWLDGGWLPAATAVALLVLPGVVAEQLLDDAASPLELGPAPDDVRAAADRLGWRPRDGGWLSLLVAPVPLRRRLVFAGTSAVEMAAAHLLYSAHPQDDEGELTRRRSALTSGDSLTARAVRTVPRLAGFDPNDRLLLAIAGGALLEGGPDVGTRTASSMLRA